MLGGAASTAHAADLDTLQSQLKQLKQQMQLLEQQLADEKSKQSQINKQHEQQVAEISKKADNKEVVVAAAAPEQEDEGIKIGGAVRFNYSTNTYDEDTQDRGGDLDFEVFRLNLSGEISDISVNGDFRF